MCGGVAQDVEPFRILVGDDREIGVALDRVARIDQLAVDFARERGAREPRADGGRHLGHGYRCIEGLLRTVGQSDYGHFGSRQTKRSQNTVVNGRLSSDS